MKVWGIYPYEGRMSPRPRPHWIEMHSGVEHNPPPSTARGHRRAKARAERQAAKKQQRAA
jgi:hypothetical protein